MTVIGECALLQSNSFLRASFRLVCYISPEIEDQGSLNKPNYTIAASSLRFLENLPYMHHEAEYLLQLIDNRYFASLETHTQSWIWVWGYRGACSCGPLKWLEVTSPPSWTILIGVTSG
jgi:hypothetical protein